MMKKEVKKQGASRNAVIAAVRTITCAAKSQHSLQSDCMQLLNNEEVDEFPPANVQEELESKGLQWSIILNGVAFSPFGYAPAFRSERQMNPEKWPDAHDMAIDELELMGKKYDEYDKEYMTELAEQEVLTKEAIDTAVATIAGLHEIVRAAKGRWKYLRALEAAAIEKLCIPFAGFRFDENAGCWGETGVEEVDELLWDLVDEMPELLVNDAIGVTGIELSEGKPLELSEEEAIAIVEEFLAD